MLKLSKVKLLKKKCTECRKVFSITNFHKDRNKKYGLKSNCKNCRKKYDKERYNKQCGKYIYIIKVDNVPWYIGSTNNIPHRVSNHNNNKDNGHFIYMCEVRGIDLSNKTIELWICDTKKMGYNLTNKDLKYYEHKLIRSFKEKNYPLLNSHENSEYIERERYIDEIPLEGFKFVLSEYKIKKDKVYDDSNKNSLI